ncbi:MAG TPA: nitrite/sulfite reductase [Candidatus Binatia bacterium]|nr:nitrite/sulfite reductase [Candidatus Binatia bacterium]
MYRYDSYDQRLVDERVAQFRDQVRRYLAGEIEPDAFRALRLRNGLYMQRFAHMLRISVPYGLLSSKQLRMLAHVARTYDRGYGHFTTRQNIQFNWPELKDVPDILERLASVQMHAIQTSGNCVRNITTDHLAGVARDELVDPRPYCEITRQWASFHPEFNFLPRKFKIAFSATQEERAALLTHDVGIRIVKNAAGELGYTVYAGGGLGRTPIVGQKVREFLPELDLLSYLEAILRVYNRLGRRDNIHKARIKILVKELGVARFSELVEAEWQQIRGTALQLRREDVQHFRAFFQPHAYEPAASPGSTLAARLAEDPAFAGWYGRNTRPHRVDGYRIVIVSLKAPGTPTGDVSAGQMDALADLADRHSFGELRSTHDQNLVLADVKDADLHDVWQALKGLDLATPNIGLITDLICCPGFDYCSLANAGSIGVAAEISERFESLDYQHDIGELQIKMSGCMNGCGHHSVGHIGILGVDKTGEEWYQVTLGGTPGNDAALGQKIGPSIARDRVVDAVESIVQVYLQQRETEDETFLDTVRRIGVEPFKTRVYAAAEAA